MNPLGINLSFAVKRWVEPEAWSSMVERMGLRLAQFSFDLIDPLWPPSLRNPLARAHARAAKDRDIEIHSAFVGLACYTYNNLLHPLPEGREAAIQWWKGAMEVAVELGTLRLGGPLGGLSVQDQQRPQVRKERLDRLKHDLRELLLYAHNLGIQEFLIEPTPLPREIPLTPEEAQSLLDEIDSPLPLKLCIDIGHALYRPVYGEGASIEPWLTLGGRLGLLHLQQTDGLSDSHWGFHQNKGIVDLEALKQTLKRSGQASLPVILEVFYPFELADEMVEQDITGSVKVIGRAWGLIQS